MQFAAAAETVGIALWPPESMLEEKQCVVRGLRELHRFLHRVCLRLGENEHENINCFGFNTVCM